MNDTTWFWQIVDARGLADVSSDEFVALNELVSKAERLGESERNLSEAREEIERLKAASLHHETGERITRKDLNNAHRKGAEEGRLAAHLIDGIPAERQRDEALEALRKIHNFGQSAEPDHWKFRCMARDAARTALENSKANLADANTNPPLSDLSSLRKGAEELRRSLICVKQQCETVVFNISQREHDEAVVRSFQSIADYCARTLVSGSREDGA